MNHDELIIAIFKDRYVQANEITLGAQLVFILKQMDGIVTFHYSASKLNCEHHTILVSSALTVCALFNKLSYHDVCGVVDACNCNKHDV